MTRKTIRIDELKRGPIRHEQLPLSLVARINYLCGTLYEVHPQSMEKWLDGFQRDANPESEVRWWERVTRCYLAYNEAKILNVEQKRAVFRILFRVAMGSQPEALQADLAGLPERALEEIVEMLGQRMQ
jgi:hypothetical protein